MQSLDVLRYFRYITPHVSIEVEFDHTEGEACLNDLVEELESLRKPDLAPEYTCSGPYRVTIHIRTIAGGKLFTGYTSTRLAASEDLLTASTFADPIASMIRLNLIRLRWEIGKIIEDSLIFCQLDRLIDVLADLDQLRREVEVWKQASQPEA